MAYMGFFSPLRSVAFATNSPASLRIGGFLFAPAQPRVTQFGGVTRDTFPAPDFPSCFLDGTRK